jgi:hypothetical protein
VVNGVKQDGRPDVTLWTRNKNEVQLRRETWAKDDKPEQVDSLGTETVTVPAGTFETRKWRHRSATAQSADQGDSTVYYRRQLDRVYYLTPKVPFTNLALIEVDDHQQGKTWQAGKFDQGPLHTLERARGRTELVGFGTSGVKALMIPVKSRGATIDRAMVQAAYEESIAETASSAKRRSASR